jgi:hypothetical protein
MMARVGGAPSRLVFDFAPIAVTSPMDARVKQAGFTRFDAIALDVIWRRYLRSEPHENAAIPHMGCAFIDRP